MEIHVNSFNAGELSEKMLARVDVQQYSRGCRICENFFVTPFGAAERRPGTNFLADLGDKPVKLEHFYVDNSNCYILVFMPGRLVVYSITGNIVKTLLTPYSIDDLDGIRLVQCGDVAWVCHKNYMVYELKRLSSDDFTFTEFQLTYPPVMDANLTDTTITASALSGNVALTSSADLFKAGHVNSYFTLVHYRKDGVLEKDFNADGVSDALEVSGGWTLSTHGTWTGRLTIQKSYDNGVSWIDYLSYTSSKDNNVETSGDEDDENVLYRLSMSGYEQSTTGTIKYCEAKFINNNFVVNGVVKISTVTDARHASGTVIKKIGSLDPTKDWHEPAWSDVNGYPACVEFYEERLVFAGTTKQRNTLWLSKTNDWNNFKLGDEDDAGLSYTLASSTVNSIVWLCSHDVLLIGTIDSEWKLSGSGQDEALTPTSVKCSRQSVYGSAAIPAILAGDSVLFVQRPGVKVRELSYSWERNNFVAADLTLLADHINQVGIKSSALSSAPFTRLFCVLSSGDISCLTYERDQEVIAWTNITTIGEFIDVTVLPAAGNDLIYFAVKRNNRYFLELLNYNVYLDCCLYDTEDLALLNGYEVSIVGDGVFKNDDLVQNGSIAIEPGFEHLLIGIPYLSILQPMPLEVAYQGGSTMTRPKNPSKVRVRYYDSLGGEIQLGDSLEQDFFAYDVLKDNMDCQLTLKSGVAEFNALPGWNEEAKITLTQILPYPMNISCLVSVL